MPGVNDWFRSVSALGVAFVGVVVVTLGLAAVIVPDAVGFAQATDPPAGTSAIDLIPSQVGGTLTLTGERQGTFTLNRESTDRRYGLIGDEGRVFFGGEPLAVVQMNFDGLSFFPEPEECTITPGELNPTIGVAAARLHCGDVADVRGNGVVTIDGTIGIAGDVLGMRGDLPPSGGRVDIGEETVVFTDAVLFTSAFPVRGSFGQYAMQLHDPDTDTRLAFDYDQHTHGLALTRAGRGGESNDVDASACDLTTRNIGILNPRTTVIEVSLRCPAVDVPGLGSVPIEGSIVVERVDAPF